jgi:hypothetical protein
MQPFISMKKSLFIRKAHRYLGLFIGIQFLAWTISGLYFSWNNIDDVHGDHLRKPPAFLNQFDSIASPARALAAVREIKPVDSVHSITLINMLHSPVYQVKFFSGHAGEGTHLHTHVTLVDALEGKVRPALTEEEAVAIAKQNLVKDAVVKSTSYLSDTDEHHEYREKPLPAWAIEFQDPDCTAYISAELGTFQSIRHNQWRAFDFLWMFHTMDYNTRDDFNNILLKIFSLFGLITVISGFALFIVSSRTIKKISGV